MAFFKLRKDDTIEAITYDKYIISSDETNIYLKLYVNTNIISEISMKYDDSLFEETEENLVKLLDAAALNKQIFTIRYDEVRRYVYIINIDSEEEVQYTGEVSIY